MYRPILSGLIILLLLAFSGCAKDQLKETVYHSLHDRQCVVDKNEPHCDPDRVPYEEYKKQRDDMKKDSQ